MFGEFGPEPSMQLYDRGIRRRLAPMLGDRRRIELAYSLLFSLPGTPVLRYGDEIGMGENLRLRERMAIRTPMQWSAGHQAGFSSAERTVQPVIQTRPLLRRQRQRRAAVAGSVVAAALDEPPDPRPQGVPRDRMGDMGHRSDAPANVLAIEYVWRGTSLVCLHNLAGHPVEVSLRPGTDERGVLANVMTDEVSEADRDGTHRIDLDAYDYRWYRVGGLEYAIGREAAPVG